MLFEVPIREDSGSPQILQIPTPAVSDPDQIGFRTFLRNTGLRHAKPGHERSANIAVDDIEDIEKNGLRRFSFD